MKTVSALTRMRTDGREMCSMGCVRTSVAFVQASIDLS